MPMPPTAPTRRAAEGDTQAQLAEETRLQSCSWDELSFWELCARWRDFAEARMERQRADRSSRALQTWAVRCPDEYGKFQRGQGALPASVGKEERRCHELYCCQRAELSLNLQRVIHGPDLESSSRVMHALVESEQKRLLAVKALSDIDEL